MKIFSVKKTISALLTGAILLGFTGCTGLGGANKKAVIEAAESLASNMAAADASKLIKNSTLNKKSDEAMALTELLSDDMCSDDEIAFYNAVEKTIEYEIDEDSVNVDKESASVNIIFTIADYSNVLLEDFKDINELTSAIKKADTTTVKFTAEFAKEDKEWIPDNVASKKFMKLYDYRNAEISFSLSADLIAGFIDKNESGFWIYDDGNGTDKYVDTTFIEYDYYFVPEVYDYADRGEIIYFLLKKDGQTIYTGPDMTFGDTTYLACRVDGDLIGLDFLSFFEDGSYTIELYYRGANGDELIDSNTVAVEKSVIPVVTGGTDPTGALLDGEGEYYAFYDQNFRNYVISAEWFDYDEYLIDDETYSSDVETIAFSLEVKSTCTMAVDYGFYYTDKEDENSIGEALENPVYSNTITPTSYTNGTFYDIDYDVNGQAAPGYYMFVLYEAGTSNVLMYGFCLVS